MIISIYSGYLPSSPTTAQFEAFFPYTKYIFVELCIKFINFAILKNIKDDIILGFSNSGCYIKHAPYF